MRRPKILRSRLLKMCFVKGSAFTLAFLLLVSPLTQVYAQEVVVPTGTTSAPQPSTEVAPDTTSAPAGDPTVDAPVDSTDITPAPTDQVDPEILPPVEEKPTDDADIKDDNPESMMSLVGQQQDPASIPRSTTKQLLPDTDQSSGSLIFSYPLSIPPGRNNLQPDLKLTYNNQSLEDALPFGIGWSTNIPYIERVNRKGSEQLYSQDYFNSSLSGELVNISGSSWGAKSENGDFLKYTYSGNTWTVKDKNGTTYTFGSVAGTRQDDPSNSSHIYKWMLEEIRDTNNNYIKYTYYKDAGQIYPASIIYTGNGTTDGIFEIDFLRQSCSDVMTSFKAGFGVTSNYRIYEVDIKVNSTLQHKYALAYTSGGNGTRSTLTSITESGVDDSSVTTTLPANAMVYRAQTTGWTSDSNWSMPSRFNRSSSTPEATQIADVNGDGLADVLFSGYEWDSGSSSYVATSHVWINTGSGFSLDTSWTIPELFMDNSSNDLGTRVADVNGDGLADILSTKYVYSGGSWNAVNKVYINNGTGWTYDSSWTIPNPLMGWTGSQTDNGTRIFDVNGDGLPDIIYAPYTGTPVTYLNTGTGWTSNSNWAMPSRFMFNSSQQQATDIADVNGDGLADVLFSGYEWDSGTSSYIHTTHVWINNSDGWTLDTSWSIPEYFLDSGYNDVGTRIADVNGDGLADILFSGLEWDSGTSSYVWHKRVNINNGTGWTYDSSWTIPEQFVACAGSCYKDAGVRLADLNGDGIPEVIKADYTGTPTTYTNNGSKIDSLVQITSSQGSVSTITYKPSTQYTSGGSLLNPHSPMVLETVSQIATSDAFGNTSTESYAYSGGSFYFTGPFDRKFAGFNKVTTTDPAGNVSINYYHQGDSTDSSNGEYSDQRSKIGSIYRVEQYDGSGNLYKVKVNKWDNYNIGTDHDFVKLARVTTLTYDGTGSHKDTTQEYSYDNTYGNITTKTDWGLVTGSTDGSFTDTGSDKSVESISYVANTGNYVVSLPYDDSTVNQSSVKVRQTRTYYDGNSLGTVGNGNPTKVEKWVTGSTYVNNQYTYDSTYGTLSTSVDPDSNTTTYSYDTYHLHPTTVTDALTNATAYTYDYSSGKVIQTTNPNGFVYQNIYDGLDRTVEEKIPGQSSPYTPVTKTTYAYTDTSGAVSLHRTDYLDGSTTADSYLYYDGLGRLIQKRKESSTSGNFNVKDYAYNNIGLTQKESLPYSSSGSSRTSATATSNLYITYTYDPLYRIATQADASGTTSYTYNLWKTSVTDHRGKVKDLYVDARDNLIQVDEHNSGSTYSTYYTWNLNSKLLSITDALSNVRNFTYDGLGNRLTAEDLHASADTTYGSWSYSYDNAGNLTQSVSPEAKTVNYTYDALNRPLTENYTGAAGTEITYVYDSCTNGIGHLCSATMTSGANTSYTYDSAGNTASEAKIINGTTYTTSYTYDRQGNILTITYPDSAQVRYTYNTAGLLSKVERKESGGSFTDVVSSIDYAPTEKPTVTIYANGLNTTNTYDASNLYRLTNKQTSNVTNRNPVITLTGASLVNKNVGDTYTDAGATASDAEDGNLTSSITTTGTVNTSVAGVYQIVYAVVDSGSAPAARVIRTIIVHSTTGPSLSVKALVVGGGGGGGVSYGGGGGAGGYQYDASHTITTGSYSITVGAGGAAQSNGGNSSFDTITATGGGKGGDIVQNGSNGGSGGGGGLVANGGTGSQGNNGGNGGNNGGGGGGGANAAGTTSTGSNGGNGGNGTANSITGTSVTYAGGGGGGAHSSSGNGGSAGSGGGGLGGGSNHSATNGTANTGGGGGGGSNMSADVGAGGSGVVIISYVTSNFSAYTVSGGTVTTNGSNTVRTFTSSGTLSISVPANTNPVISMNGASLINKNVGDTWTDPGYTATDAEDGSLTSSVTTTGSVNTASSGTYQLVYSVTDSAGAEATRMIRTVVVHSPAVPYLQDIAYEYDGNGNITKIIDSSNTSASKSVTYTYDDLNRLTQASATGVASGQSTYTQNFAYNAIGNITSGPIGSYLYSGNSGTNYANPHAATSINSVTNTYDKDGNNLTDGTLTNTWNYKNQLSTSTNGTFTRTYLYDEAGNRVSSSDGTTTTVYPNKLYTYDGTKKTKSIYAGNQLVATIETVGAVVTPYYDHTDHLNSIAVVSDSSGASVSLLDYFPFGSQRISSGSYNSTRQYIGERFDSDTTLNYLNSRYANTLQGRFISQDPIFWTPENFLNDPQQLNSYSYARNNPITLSDPSGKWFGEYLSGKQSGSDFAQEVGNATLYMGSGWQIAMNNPYVPAIAGAYPLAIVMSGGSLSTGLVGLAGGVSAQYVGDVAGNFANGKTGGDLVRSTSNPTQYAISVASVGLTSTLAAKAVPVAIGGISAATSFIQDRAGGQQVSAGGIMNNIVNGVGAMATEGLIRQANGIPGRLPSNNSTADFIGAHAIANYTKQAVSAAGQFVTSAVSSIVNKLSGSH